jgi:hypothetical protein
MKLSTHGLVQETLTLHPTILTSATKVLARIGPLICPLPQSQQQNISDPAYQTSANATALNGTQLPSNTGLINFVGYSGAGAVASLVSMMLDGALNTTVPAAQQYVGSKPGVVRCVSLGSPPCISRALVPQYIVTIINGDDVIARAEPLALNKLKRSVQKSSNVVRTLASNFISVTTKGLRQYSTGHHDFESLKPAGRVFYIKKRRKMQGATIARVLRGNLREDMLWQLHEVVVTSSMQKHHSLDEYIKTLVRV